MKTYTLKYSSREEEIRATLPLQECIRRIKEKYNSGYDAESTTFDAWDQLLACEAVAESAPINTPYEDNKLNIENTSVSGMYSGGCKQEVTFELTESKIKVISELKECTYKTEPIKIAKLLELLFSEWNSKAGHWLFIAQHYPPRRINFVIADMVKAIQTGRIRVINPSAYFTLLIKFRKQRKTK